MLSWNAADELFLDQALDSPRRQRSLRALGWRRTLAFAMTLVFMISMPYSCQADSYYQGLLMVGTLAGFGILNALMFGKLHSEVLLLKYIDRIERDKLADDANDRKSDSSSSLT